MSLGLINLQSSGTYQLPSDAYSGSFTVSGVASTDVVIGSLSSNNSNAILYEIYPSTNTINFRFNGTADADTEISYVVTRQILDSNQALDTITQLMKLLDKEQLKKIIQEILQ